jgi:acid phosphatase class B
MPIVKVNLHKVNAERSLEVKAEQISIKNNVSLKSVDNLDFDKDGKKGLKFGFEFDCNYEPKLGKIEVGGQIIYVEEAKLVDEIKESWDKDKRIPTAVMEQVINAALHKGNIQAIKTAEDVNLPSPLPLPKVAKGKKE